MKKILFIMTLAIAGVTMSSMAQQTFEVPVIKEFVKVKTGTVFRKTPNASSDKLIRFCEGDGDFCYFKFAKSGDDVSVDYVAVNGVSGDWYDVYVSDELWGSENAYIPKNSATIVRTKPLSLPAQDYLHIAQIKTGKFKDWYIQFKEEGMNEAELVFGIPVDGKVLMLKHMRVFNSGGEPNKLVQENDFYKDQYGDYAFSFSSEFGDTFVFNLDKFVAKTDVVEKLLDNFYSMGDYYAIFFCENGSNNWNCIPINKEKFKGNLFELK